jgi:hypothetical protein
VESSMRRIRLSIIVPPFVCSAAVPITAFTATGCS